MRSVIAAVGFLAAILGLTSASAQRTTERLPSLVTPSLYGRDVFEFYCAPCHGTDGRGRGPVAVALKDTPSDLTKLSARNGGTFPKKRVEAFVTSGRTDAPAHGTSDMPIWGPTFRSLESSDALVRTRIANVVEYIESIQAK
jgi:mono/diheme cytochrome c family protein